MRQENATYSLSVRPAAIDHDGYSNAMAQAQQTFDCGDVFALDVDEKILLHGTSSDNANSIKGGLRPSNSPECSLWSGGFLSVPCVQKQSEHVRTSQLELQVARLALGDSYIATETRKNDRRPPVRHGSSISLSVCLSIYLSTYLQDQKLRNSARLPSCLNITTSNNETILRNFFIFYT